MGLVWFGLGKPLLHARFGKKLNLHCERLVDWPAAVGRGLDWAGHQPGLSLRCSLAPCIVFSKPASCGFVS
jgi:hypothetical protein